MIPRLSVILPCRNGADTLPRAIASALAVPIAELEVIVIDDGSTDGTAELLDRASEIDPRIIAIHRDGDHGVAAARNRGIAAARAPVLGFLDTDEVWEPELIARRLAWHEANPRTAMSFANCRTLLPDGAESDRFGAYAPRFVGFLAGRTGIVPLNQHGFTLLAGENPVCPSTVLASREAVLLAGCFNPTLRKGGDWDLWLRLARRGAIVASTAIEARHADRPGCPGVEAEERLEAVSAVLASHGAEAWRHGVAAGLANSGAVALARAELAMHRRQPARVLAHSIAAALCQPSSRRLGDALRAALVLTGIKAAPRNPDACAVED